MDAQMDAAAQAVIEVGREHGFSAMLVVGLLIALGFAGGMMIRAHLKLATRLATAQENSYEQHVKFAEETGVATKQMAASTVAIEKAITTMADGAAMRQHVIDDLRRRSIQVHRAAQELVDVAADHLEKTDPNIAKILRRIAEGLSKE